MTLDPLLGRIDVISALRPKGGSNLPVAQAEHIEGGYRSVATIADRDAIPAEHRREGMLVRVNTGATTWVLGAGLTNADWSAFGGGGGPAVPDPASQNGKALFSDGTNYVLRFIEAADVLAPFEVSTFSGPSTQEVGQALPTPAFTASYNRAPTTAVLTDNDGSAPKDVISTPTAFNSDGSFTKTVNNQSVTFTLTASEGGPTDAAQHSVAWQPRVYFGVGVDQVSALEAFIEALASNALAPNRNRTFNVTAGAGQHIYYAFPTSYGTPTFTVGGFEGGFILVGSVSVTNAHGVTQSYDLWKSVNPNLGSTTVVVT